MVKDTEEVRSSAFCRGRVSELERGNQVTLCADSNLRSSAYDYIILQGT